MTRRNGSAREATLSAAFNQLLDRLEQDGKAVAKAAYRGPLIHAAKWWRRLLGRTCFIGVTGSAGKTTTKELLHAALAGRHRCTKNADTNNQLYSIARTLVSIAPGTRFCVQEVGASEPGGLDPMLKLLKPQVGVVTNVGTDHFKAFRTREAVAAEKSRLIASLPADGIAVLNADDDLVAAMARNCRARVVTYGLHGNAMYQADLLATRWPDRLGMRIRHGGDCAQVETLLHGRHHAGNVLAAVATACSLGIPLDDAAQAVSRHGPLLGRMSVHSSARGITFIRDDWKAPHWSLPSAFDFIAEARAPRKLIVIGTISDYGGNASKLYRRSVARALEAADHVVLIGPRAASLASRSGAAADGRLAAFDTVRDAAAWLDNFARRGDLVLLKGSILADHLARLALAMDREVGCWRHRCGRHIFCDHCRLLGETSPP
jgi:UDP-N-acetylmuramoyl-tripeptide--D-alanyl-D-alanine ligase